MNYFLQSSIVYLKTSDILDFDVNHIIGLMIGSNSLILYIGENHPCLAFLHLLMKHKSMV